MLKEVGEKTELCIGECQKRGLPPFDHSWVTLNGKIVDLAIYLPLDMRKGECGGPVVLGVDVISKGKPSIDYGITTGLLFDRNTSTVIKVPFNEYMSEFPDEKDGLWTVIENAHPSSRNFDIAAMKEKYKAVKRVVVR